MSVFFPGSAIDVFPTSPEALVTAHIDLLPFHPLFSPSGDAPSFPASTKTMVSTDFDLFRSYVPPQIREYAPFLPHMFFSPLVDGSGEEVFSGSKASALSRKRCGIVSAVIWTVGHSPLHFPHGAGLLGTGILSLILS